MSTKISCPLFFICSAQV